MGRILASFPFSAVTTRRSRRGPGEPGPRRARRARFSGDASRCGWPATGGRGVEVGIPSDDAGDRGRGLPLALRARDEHGRARPVRAVGIAEAQLQLALLEDLHEEQPGGCHEQHHPATRMPMMPIVSAMIPPSSCWPISPWASL